MQDERRTKAFVIRMTPELHEQLRAIAELEERSMSATAVRAIRRYIKDE